MYSIQYLAMSAVHKLGIYIYVDYIKTLNLIDYITY